MGSLKTLLCGLTLGLVCLGQAGPALSQIAPDPMPRVAACTGRLSALLEFQWLLGDPGSELTEARRDAMAELLEVVTPLPHRTRAMQLRLEAKLATALYLRQGLAAAATPGRDRRAEAEIVLLGCQSFIVS